MEVNYNQYDLIVSESKDYYQVCMNNSDVYVYGTSHFNSEDCASYINALTKIDQLYPDVILVEGLAGGNCNNYLSGLSLMDGKEVLKKYGESTFFGWYAHIRGIQVFSPEPNICDEVSHIKAIGYSEDSIMLYMVSQFLHQEKNLFKKKESPNDILQKYIDFINSLDMFSEKYSVDYIIGCIKRICGQNNLEDYIKVVSRFCDPVYRVFDGKVHKEVINEIAREANLYRDFLIIEMLRSITKINKKILVLFGASYVYVLKNILERD